MRQTTEIRTVYLWKCDCFCDTWLNCHKCMMHVRSSPSSNSNSSATIFPRVKAVRPLLRPLFTLSATIMVIGFLWIHCGLIKVSHWTFPTSDSRLSPHQWTLSQALKGGWLISPKTFLLISLWWLITYLFTTVSEYWRILCWPVVLPLPVLASCIADHHLPTSEGRAAVIDSIGSSLRSRGLVESQSHIGWG